MRRRGEEEEEGEKEEEKEEEEEEEEERENREEKDLFFKLSRIEMMRILSKICRSMGSGPKPNHQPSSMPG